PFRRISPGRRQSSFSVVVVIVGNKDGLRGAGIVPVARVISVRAPRNRARQEVGMTVYKGNCFCGAVEIAVDGEPVGAGYCHCASCRSWSASPVNAFTLWRPEAITVTKGE